MTHKQLIKIGVNQKTYPQHIFKYRADNSNTEKIIIHNELWFSNPLLFNDPYDCNTPISTTTSLADIKSWLTDVGVFAQSINELADILQKNPNLMKEKTEKAMSELGVCCFSTLDDSILQWSHYSDYHKGICFKFDITEDLDFFLTPVIVAYRKVMQHYNHFIQSERIVDYLIRPKYYEWSYESEIRIVKTSQNIRDNAGQRAFKFNDSALKEVIFGTKTPDTIITKYKQLCNNNNKKHAKFYKMELGSGVHYKLLKQSI
jgi:Protein of unknown function (DUF2971)